MQVILETDEAWSIMTLVVSQVLDQVDLSDEAKAVLRRWRTDHNDGSLKRGHPFMAPDLDVDGHGSSSR